MVNLGRAGCQAHQRAFIATKKWGRKPNTGTWHGKPTDRWYFPTTAYMHGAYRHSFFLAFSPMRSLSASSNYLYVSSSPIEVFQNATTLGRIFHAVADPSGKSVRKSTGQQQKRIYLRSRGCGGRTSIADHSQRPIKRPQFGELHVQTMRSVSSSCYHLWPIVISSHAAIPVVA